MVGSHYLSQQNASRVLARGINEHFTDKADAERALLYKFYEKGLSKDSPFCLSPQEVSNCFDWIVEQHARTNPAHHVANLLAHRRLVAVDGAPLAGGLLCAKLASL